ncbi:uncharacterized protein METZ01_LOCUS12946 [marine metagenome]|uniref:Uncharacterized protein n=1 Tax=marine metagenome TaxID=408172 RepID=A0A381NZM5_9ZZZZ
MFCKAAVKIIENYPQTQQAWKIYYKDSK